MTEVFRVEKSKNFTVMSNFHLKDKRLTLKAKGLLSQILSLPEDWDYTVKGLAYINIEHKETIGKIIRELIETGYIIRSQERGECGRMGKSSYVIYEEPHDNPAFSQKISGFSPQTEKPSTVKPDKPHTENPSTVKPSQINTNKQITKQKNTDVINHSFNQTCGTPQTAVNEGMNEGLINPNSDNSNLPKMNYRDYYKRIKDNIEYDVITDMGYGMIKVGDKDRINEIIDVMVDMLFPIKPTVRIGDSELPYAVVESRLYKITSEHMVYIIDCMGRNTTLIKNMSAYLRKVIYNAPTTYNNHVTADVNNILHGG